MPFIDEEVSTTGDLYSGNVDRYNSVTVHVTDPAVATITYETSNDNSNWSAVSAYNIYTGLSSTTSTGKGRYVIDVSGVKYFRARVSAYTSGMVKATVEPSERHSAFGGYAVEASSEIQRAIDALPDSGGIIHLPAGTFIATNIKLDGSNHTKSNVVLKGVGSATHIKKPHHKSLGSDELRKSNVIQATSGHGFEVRNLKVSGNLVEGGLKPPYCTKHTLGNTFGTEGRVICTSLAGTSSSGAATDRVFRVTALGAGQVSDATNISNDVASGKVVEVTNEKFNEETGAGYVNSYELDNDYAFRACIYLNGLTEAMKGVVIEGVDATASVNGCILPGKGPLFASLAGYGTFQARIIGNRVYDAGATCIGGGGKVEATIANNVIGGTTSSGIRCDEGSDRCSIIGNTIDTDNLTDANGGISVYKSDYVTCTGNFIRGAILGITYTESDYGTCTSNIILECGAGIGMSKMDCGIVSSNVIHDCTSDGIRLTQGLKNVIMGNTVRSCGGSGIDLNDGSGVSLIGNTLMDNDEDGITVRSGCDHAMIVGNICQDNNVDNTATGSGIRFEGTVVNATVSNNRCLDSKAGGSKTQKYGLYAPATLDKSHIVNNRFSDNATAAIELNAATGNIVAMNSGDYLLDYNGNLLLSAATGGTMYLLGAAGSENVRISAGGGTIINSIELAGGSNGNSSAPKVGVQGSSTDIDLRLVPKGAGAVRFGTWTTNGDAAVNGYITVKDSGGTTRKLATIA